MKKNYIFREFSPALLHCNFMVVLILLLFAGSFTADAQTTRYVKSGASGDGSSWQNASGDLQTIIDSSVSNDQVWVAAGTYTPAEGTAFSMKDGVAIYGSFPDTGTPTINDRSIAEYMSVLQANGSNVIRNDGNGLTTAAVLDGFTVTGAANNLEGGIYNYNVSPTFTNLIIAGNSTYQFGGGMTNKTSSPVITNVVFHNNSAGGYGGAMSNEDNSYPVLTNVTMTNNTASMGSGLFSHTGSSVSVRNSIIWGNYNPDNYSDNIYNSFTGTSTLYFSLVGDSGGSTGWTYQAGNDGGGNIDSDPLLNDASTFYSLTADSPAIDRGNDGYVQGVTSDLTGNSRFSGVFVDMGAQEFQVVPGPDLPIRYVMQGATGDGSSWANASGNLQAMISQSAAGNEVWVAAGTYIPSLGFYFVMKEGVKIYGGFPATGNPGLTERNWTVNPTILDGNGSHLIRNNNNGLTPAAVLDGFTLQAAPISAIYNNGVSPKFDNLIITQINYNGNGGAMYNLNSSPEISNSLLYGNTAFSGGAIYNDASSPVLTNLTITANRCTNLNDVAGGGIMNVNNSNPVIRNTILWGNSAGGYYASNVTNINSTPVFEYSIIEDTSGQTGWNAEFGTDGGNNSAANPLFSDATSADYTLQAGSPAIDGGNSAYFPNAATSQDIAGYPRLYGTSIDIGAFEAGEVVLLDIRYVREGGTGDGSTWADASGNLQAMINQSAPGNEVWVAAGTYTRSGTESFSMKDGVKIYGGFAASGTPSFSQRSWKTNITILSGGNTKGVIRNSGVTLTRAALLDGFTITNGNTNSGGGIYNDGVSPSFENLLIKDNRSGFAGAGMYNSGGAPRLYNVTITNNYSETLAGAMYNSSCPVEIVQCLITNNTGVQSAGAMYNYDSNMKLINSVVANNISYYHTGGFNGYAGSPEIKNSIIWGNKQGSNVNNFAPNSIPFKFYNSIIQGSGGSAAWNSSFGADFGGNIDADPMFTNPDENDFTTLEGSPVVEAGRNGYYMQAASLSDFGGNPRLQGPRIDIGLYEKPAPVYPLLPIRYVKAGGTGDGSSWENASGDLQMMIDQSVSGNQVWVAAGTHLPQAGQFFSMKEGVSIYGGFADNGTPAMADRNFADNVTVLAGNGESVVANENTGITSATELNGFTITNGNSINGGGIINIYCSPTLANLIIRNNTASTFGAGMYNEQASPVIVNTLIANNTGAQMGGGVYNLNSAAELINVTITKNSSSGQGNGIYSAGNASMQVSNSIIWDNPNSTGNAVAYSGTPIQFTHSIVQGSGGSSGWNSSFGTDNGNNLAVNPQFIGGGDYSLQNGSPATDAGDNTLFTGTTTIDLAGNPRTYGNSIDMGAYEEQGAVSLYGIRYVKQGGTGDGGSWDTASGNLQLMISQSGWSNEVWVAAGTYQAAAGTSFVMKPGVRIYGGFSAQGGEDSIWDRDRRINIAVLQGNGASVISNDDTELDQNARLDGFTITGGTSAGDGGGIYNNNVGPVLANLIIKNNTAAGNGGGIANINSTPFFRSNEVRGNSATLGGGIYNRNVDVAIMTDIAIIDNTAETGGGMYNMDSAYQTVNTTIAGNTATNAAGVYTTTTSGGNKYFSLNHGIIWGNRNSDESIAIIDRDGGEAYIQSSIIEGSPSGPEWNSEYGTDQNGNIDTNPLFADAANGNYSLSDESPAVNFGSNDYYGYVFTEYPDAAGNPRSLGEGIDLGAYENQSIASQAVIRYVKPVASGTGDGRSWANASDNLTLMISQSQNYNQVWVAQGTYQPSQGQPFRMKNGVAIYGGFPDSGTPTMAERDWAGNVTTLTGNGETVVRNNNLNNTAILDGFTITGGDVPYNGGGMYNDNSSPTLTNLVFSGNVANNGAGMYNFTSAPTLTNVLMTGNTAQDSGGAMFSYLSPVVMNNVTMTNNTAGSGGGMYAIQSNLTMSHSIISYNTSSFEGGGIGAYNSSPTLKNVLISHNTTNNFGGGVRLRDGAMTMINCNIVDNISQYSGGGLSMVTATADIKNSILWGNSATALSYTGTLEYYNGNPAFSYSLVEGSGGSNNWNTEFGTDGGNNIAANPAFADAVNNNYQLLGSSPAINAGNTAFYADAETLTDLAGNPRLNGSAIDMGILENQAVNIDIRYVRTDGTGDGTSWANASGNLAQMLDESMSGNEVWVAAGTYETNDVPFRMPNNVRIYGGFPATGEPDMTLRDWKINVTILDGEDSSVVIDNSEITDAAILDGFTVRRGNGYFGAGIINSYASPTLRNLIIEDNQAYAGAGINNYGGSPILSNVIIRNNITSGYGAAINSSDNSYPIIYNALIHGNTGTASGICTGNNATTSVISSTIVDNTGSEGALVSYGNGLNELRNSILWGNTDQSGEPSNFYFQSNPTKFYNSIVQGTIGYSGWYSNAFNGGGNLDTAPLLDTEYSPQAGSPAINAGNNTLYPSGAPVTDYAGNTRIFEGIIDIGAYESQGDFTELDIRYVRTDGTGDGSTWTNASGNLQQMIDESIAGNQVWVAAGNHQPATSASFAMKSGVEIYGGFPGTGEPDMAARNFAVNTTTLSGNGSRVINNASNSLTETAILDGFTITGGTTPGKGAGIYNFSASPTLRNLIINQNNTTGTDYQSSGAGIANINSSPIITNVLITGNQSYEAGGMLNLESNPVITNVTIANNTAISGAGMVNENSEPEIRNSIIWGNTSTSGDEEIINYNAEPTFSYSNVYYSGGWNSDLGTNGGGNSNANPMFEDAGNGLFTPQIGSPAVNGGNTSYFTDAGSATDVAGNPRLLGTIDIGAYENQDPAALVDIRYVKTDGTGDGLTWATASNDLQLMINQSNPNNKVYVAAGTYQPATGEAFTMKDAVKIYGSFPTTGDPVMDDRDFTANVTTLQGSGNAVLINDNNNLSDSALLDGFTLTGGSSALGGGIVNNNSSPAYSNLIITGNASQGNGGGICNTNVVAQYSNITVVNNTAAGNGGGIANTANSFVVMLNGKITGNTATAQGGGVYNYESQMNMLNSLLTDNTADNGGAAYGSDGYLNTVNTTIAGNTTSAGAALSGDLRLRVRNSIVWGNATTEGAISNIDAQHESSDFSNSIIQGGFDGGSWNTGFGEDDGNNSGSDPMFTDAGIGDYSLAGGSPATNAGNNQYYSDASTTNIATDTDAAGNPRLFDGIIDMGGYENQSVTSLYDIRYVREGATGNGSSWENASGNFQLMINQSQAGNQIWVAEGSFTASNNPFSMKEGVEIYGGFPAQGNPGMAERDWEVYVAYLTANYQSSVISNNNNNLTAAAVLDGFFIAEGFAEYGGGIYNLNVSPTFKNLIIYQNDAMAGGGMYNDGGSILMDNVQFISNNAMGEGAGMYNDNTYVTFTNGTFEYNYSQDEVGAVYNYQCSIDFYNVAIINNFGARVGAMSSYQSDVRIVNGTITVNDGSDVFENNASFVTFENSIIWENYGAFVNNQGEDSFANSLVQGSGGSTSWDASFGTDNGNNIDSDPYFTEYENTDFTLQANSPAINAGNNTFFPNAAMATDLLGNPRIFGSAIDMGAYENPGTIECSITTEWNGTEWSNGEPVSNDYMAIIAGNFVSTGDITACSLIVTGTPTVTMQSGHNLYIKGVVNVADGALVTLENNSHLLQDTDTYQNNNTGNISVHRNSSLLYRNDYTLWSSPVAGQNIFDFSSNTVASRFYTYNPEADHYESIPEMGPESDREFNDAEGILIRMPNGAPEAGYVEGTTPIMYDGTFTGVPNNGVVWKVLSLEGNGYNAVGNPYPSPISLQAFFDTNEGYIDGAIYLWRKKNAASVTSAYCTVNSEMEFVSNGQSGSDDPNGILQTGQGFIVKAIDNGGWSDVVFINEMRSGSILDDSSFFRMSNPQPPQVESHRFWLNLLNDAGQVAQMLVGYKSNATMGVDNGIDAKFINDSETGLNSVLNGQPYVIQGRSLPFNVNDVVPLQFKTPLAGSFTLSIDHMDGMFTAGQDIYLRDKLTATVHELTASDYTFATDMGVFNERFEVIYTNGVLDTDVPVIDSNSIVIYQQESSIHINSGSAVMAHVKIFDIRGRLVYEKSDINASETAITDMRAEEQMLIVQVTTTENIVVSKKIVY